MSDLNSNQVHSHPIDPSSESSKSDSKLVFAPSTGNDLGASRGPLIIIKIEVISRNEVRITCFARDRQI